MTVNSLCFLSSQTSPDTPVPCVSSFSLLSAPRKHFLWPLYSFGIVEILFHNFVQLVHHFIVLFFQKVLSLRSDIHSQEFMVSGRGVRSLGHSRRIIFPVTYLLILP
jgi:hypothetical protein